MGHLTRADPSAAGLRLGAALGWRPAGWAVGALLYGLSWPLVDGLNLTWLAWGAFVPLFVALERQERFAGHALRALGFMALATALSCWWWFVAVPAEARGLAWAAAVQDILLETVPLLLLYPIRRRIGFDGGLAVLVFLWPLWEWTYNHWEMTMGYLVLAYSQAGNVWLVQPADLLGVWGMTGWVVLVNVAIRHAYRASRHRADARFWRTAAVRVAVLVAVPMAYGAVRLVTVAPTGTLRATAVFTDFDPSRLDADEARRRLERVVHLTDSARVASPRPVDLVVWPEGALPFPLEDPDVNRFVTDAIGDWGAPLLTGFIGPGLVGGDTAAVNRTLLIDGQRPPQHYDKRRLVPFKEGFPHDRVVRRFAAARAAHDARGYYTPGSDGTRLALTDRSGRTVMVATPLCHEQQFPALWAGWTQDGADVFAHLSFESWFGDHTFQRHFLSIARLRAIENRRSVVRVSNGGPTAFVDGFGRVLRAPEDREGAATASVPLYAGLSLYARLPHLIVVVCLGGIAGVVLWRRGRWAPRRATGRTWCGGPRRSAPRRGRSAARRP